MPKRDIVVIGASAGGVKALIELVSNLPHDLPAAVFAVVHIPEGARSVLPSLLSRAGPLEATTPRDGEPIEHGRIYVAPTGLHLEVNEGQISLIRGPRENYHRPAIDRLFRTAALAYGPRVVAVVLSGADGDGTAGLQAVKTCGGVAVVQDPDEAAFRRMPQSALEYVEVDYCLPLQKIATLLTTRLVGEATKKEGEEKGRYPMADKDMELEQKMSVLDPATLHSNEHPGELSWFTCPDCAGPLYEIRKGELSRYRCRVGHGYSGAEDVLEGNRGAIEDALYSALNKLLESAAMAGELAGQARRSGREIAAARFEKMEQEARQQAEVIRPVLLGSPRSVEHKPEASDLE